MLVAHALTQDDRLTAGRVVGLIAGFIGVVVLIGPELISELGADVLAEFACLAASCSYAFGAVLSRRLRGLSPMMVASGQLTMSTVLLLPVVLLFDRPSAFFTASNAALAALFGIALLSSAARLPHLLPPDRACRRDQRAAGDVPHSGQRDPDGHRAAG